MYRKAHVNVRWLGMSHLPQSYTARYLGFEGGVDMPLNCSLLEFGANGVKQSWEVDVPAPPHNRLFYVTDGATGEIEMSGRVFPLRSGRMYLIPPQQAFCMRWFPPGAFGFVHFTATDATGLDIFREVREVRELPMPGWLKRLTPPYSKPLPDAADGLLVPTVWMAAIAQFARAPDVAALWLRASVSLPLQKVLSYVQEHNSATLRVREIAAAVGMSPTNLSQAFRRAFGHSLKFHQTQDLLQRALQLLNGTNLTIRQIAEELGYTQPSYFERVFRKRLGLSPLRHRNDLHPRGVNRRLYAATRAQKFSGKLPLRRKPTTRHGRGAPPSSPGRLAPPEP